MQVKNIRGLKMMVFGGFPSKHSLEGVLEDVGFIDPATPLQGGQSLSRKAFWCKEWT